MNRTLYGNLIFELSKKGRKGYSLPQDYARICSGGGPVSRNLSQLYTDTTVEDLDYLKSSLILAGGAAVLGVLLLVLLGE